MMSDKKERVDPGSEKAQSISVGEYQNTELVKGGWGNMGREKGMWDLWEAGNQEKGNEM